MSVIRSGLPRNEFQVREALVSLSLYGVSFPKLFVPFRWVQISCLYKYIGVNAAFAHTRVILTLHAFYSYADH